MKRSQSHIVTKCNSEKITYDLSPVLKKKTLLNTKLQKLCVCLFLNE